MTREDFLQLMELSKQMHEEAPNFRDYSFSVEKVARILSATQVPENRAFLTFHKDGDIIKGFFVGRVQEHFFSKDLVAHDLAIYVRPEYRGSSLFVRMVKEFEAWAKDQGAKEIMLGHVTGIDPEKIPNLFPRLDYKLKGTLFHKET